VPIIYFAAITLGRPPDDQGVLMRRAGELASALRAIHGWLAVYDPWHRIDLSGHGFTPDERQQWMSRPPSPIPDEGRSVDERIIRVTDEPTLIEFEAVHNEGFGAKPTPPGTYYRAPLLRDERVRLFLARDGRHGAAIGTAMACVDDEVVGIYGVSVLPAFRRRGIGRRLTRAAAASSPDRPAVLQPSAEGLSMYRRMGFEPFGEFGVWVRPGP
jgi:ribosomal protein S18 acetylase RimI-like enzyme